MQIESTRSSFCSEEREPAPRSALRNENPLLVLISEREPAPRFALRNENPLLVLISEREPAPRSALKNENTVLVVTDTTGCGLVPL